VCRGSLDDVVGVVNVAKLLVLGSPAAPGAARAAGAAAPTLDARISAYAVPAVFVPETLTGMELLEQFRKQSTRIVFVVDEYGVVQGLMTPMDMLEAITGELQPSTQVDAWATQRPDGSWLIDGGMPVSELKARLDIRELPDEDKGRYNTVAGLLLSVSGRLLAVAEQVEAAGWLFEVLDLDGKRIDKVLVSVLPPAAAFSDEAD
jgi:putative hemolysin